MMTSLPRTALLAVAATGAAACAMVLPAPAGAREGVPGCARADLTVTCSYLYSGATEPDGAQVDGLEQTFTVPAGVSQVSLAAVGASGGADGIDTSRPFGGTGGSASRTVTVTPGQVLYVEVGGTGMANEWGTPPLGGFNGGGNGGSSGSRTGAAGGGASDVRTVPRATALSVTDSRLVVAGAGGGNEVAGTVAGGNAGQPGEGNLAGQAGTDTMGGAGGPAGELVGGSSGFPIEPGAPGVLGAGGAGGGSVDDPQGGGGGGGRYGGGGGGAGGNVTISGGAGGGGSSYAPGGTIAPVPAGTPASVTISYSMPVTVSASSGNTQSATAGQPFGSPLAVQVSDLANGPLPGVNVTYTVLSGSASFAGGSTVTVISDGNGVATAPALTAGSTAGPVTVTASAGGSAAAFMETVTAAGPARADLTIALSTPSQVAHGSTYAATITITNKGPSTASTILTGFLAPTGTRISNPGGGTVIGQSDLFRTTSLASGASASYSLTLIAANHAGHSYHLAATLSGTVDPKYSNNLTLTVTNIT